MENLLLTSKEEQRKFIDHYFKTAGIDQILRDLKRAGLEVYAGPELHKGHELKEEVKCLVFAENCQEACRAIGALFLPTTIAGVQYEYLGSKDQLKGLRGRKVLKVGDWYKNVNSEAIGEELKSKIESGDLEMMEDSK